MRTILAYLARERRSLWRLSKAAAMFAVALAVFILMTVEYLLITVGFVALVIGYVATVVLLCVVLIGGGMVLFVTVGWPVILVTVASLIVHGDFSGTVRYVRMIFETRVVKLAVRAVDSVIDGFGVWMIPVEVFLWSGVGALEWCARHAFVPALAVATSNVADQ